MTRSLLEGYAQSGGTLADGVLELAAGRHFNIQPNRQPLPPYPEEEWQRLTWTCRTLVDDSYDAHRRALQHASCGQHPTEGGWKPDNLRWLLARVGPVSISEFGGHLGVSVPLVHKRGGFHDAIRAVFPHLDVLIANRLLFGIYSGIVPDGIADLVVEDIDWAGDSTVLLSYIKRRTAAESLNLPRQAVRLLEQWLAHSALLRTFVTPQERRRLWVGVSRAGGAGRVRRIDRVAVQRWALRHEVVGNDGKPLKIHRSRIRTTHEAMRDKTSWTGSGRATIDPNHSPQVEGDHYLTATTAAQRYNVETVIEDAQHDMLRRAHPPTVITEEDAAALANGYPHLVAELKLDDVVIAELVGGKRAVFTAACGDQLLGLHGPKGKPGPALGLLALSAGRLRPPARGQPAAAQGVLLPAVAADARRPLHGRFRSLRDPRPAGPGPLRPRCPDIGGPPCRRSGRRTSPAARGDDRMTTALATTPGFDGRSAVFAGTHVCHEAGLMLPDGTARPMFEDDVWDFTDVVGLPVQLALATRRFDFAEITDERWRLAGKELVLAMLTPKHPAVAPLPRAHRTALHLTSCAGRLGEFTRLCRWLAEHGVSSFAQIDTRVCDAYMAHRRYVIADDGSVVGEQSPAVRRAAAQVVVDLVNYRELFTADRVSAGLRPWGGATASAIAEMPSGRTENKTQPVDDTVLQPMLAAALPSSWSPPWDGTRSNSPSRSGKSTSSPPAKHVGSARSTSPRRPSSPSCWSSTRTQAHNCRCSPTTTSPTGSPPAGRRTTRS
ncbi:hypothetical protein [Kitasatospora indigofera]|uniref:hypothetical protein n=1 Tax=Kitasatospora indigofera TaxID=67307 RepID=UPI0033B92E7F